jgi:hypothetical protein
VASIHPGAAEACNGLDDDCDGVVDGHVGPCAGPCQRRACEAGRWGACEAMTAAAEICDGLDNDCDDAIDEVPECSSGSGASDGEPCGGDADCAGGSCHLGVCGQPCLTTAECGSRVCARPLPDVEPAALVCLDRPECACAPHQHCAAGACVDGVPCDGPGAACPAASTCAGDLGLCVLPCGPLACPQGTRCVGGACLPSCGSDAGCGAALRCVFPAIEPPTLGGCGAPATCESCAPGAVCVRAGDGDVACCRDDDADGFFDLGCPWGTDCDDGDPAVWNQCDTCATGSDCGGAQCVLVAPGVGVCGGPAGCHCPAAGACDATGDAPVCAAPTTCLEQVDCDAALGAGWTCDAAAGGGPSGRCVCTDPKLCPACLLDAECGPGATCQEGQCTLP